MIDSSELSELIGDIYQSSIDGAHWPRTVARLCSTFRGVRADLSIMDGLAGTIDVEILYNFPQGLAEATRRDFHLNPLVPLVLVHPLNEPFLGDRGYGFEAFKKSLYYRRNLAEVDVVDIMLLPLVRTGTRGGAISISRGAAEGPFDDADADLGRLLIPHLRRAVDISRIVRRALDAEASLDAMIARIPAAAFLLSGDGTIRHLNAAASAEIERATILRASSGRVYGAIPQVADFLDDARTTDAVKSRCRDILLRGDERGEMLITALRLDPPTEGVEGPILLVARVPEPDLVTPLEVARNAFSLTNAELTTLSQIISGRSLQEAADLLGVARSTVKSHLDSIYAKAGVGKQTELVGKVMAMIPPLR